MKESWKFWLIVAMVVQAIVIVSLNVTLIKLL